MACECSSHSAATEKERKILRIALALNAAMFVIGMTADLWAQSTGLMADALDMLADASAYGLGLLAVTRGAAFKRNSPRWSGALLGRALEKLARTVNRACFELLLRDRPLVGGVRDPDEVRLVPCDLDLFEDLIAASPDERLPTVATPAAIAACRRVRRNSWRPIRPPEASQCGRCGVVLFFRPSGPSPSLSTFGPFSDLIGR